MKRIALLVALCFAVEAQAATKDELLSALIASGKYEKVGDAVTQNLPSSELGSQNAVNTYKVSMLQKRDSNVAIIVSRIMWVIDETSVDEVAYWQGSDPAATRPFPERDSVSVWFRENEGLMQRFNTSGGYGHGFILRSIANSDSLRKINVRARFDGSKVVSKVVVD